MNRYYFEKNTPLAFHKFFWYVSMPLGIVVLTARMIKTISEMQFFSWFIAMDAVFCVVLLTLEVVCFIGFFNWKPYAWYSIMAMLCVNAVYQFFVIALYALYLPDEIGIGLGSFLGFAIYAALVGTYYSKRRPLFFQNVASGTAAGAFAANPAVQAGMGGAAPLPRIKYCRKCGCELVPESRFCVRCGAQVMEGSFV